jgi:alpha-galactosidase
MIRSIMWSWRSLGGWAAIALGLPLLGGTGRGDEFVSPGEIRQKAEWVESHLAKADAVPPFSFIYGGRGSGDLLRDWPKKQEAGPREPAITRRTTTWTDSATGLEVRCVAVEYTDYPAVEWTVYFKNIGKQSTPILENIQGIDVALDRWGDGEFVLHHWKGDTFAADLYQPLESTLGPGRCERFAPVGGRGTNGSFPYYNLARPGGGVMIAVGWPGQWASSFERDAGRRLRIKAGQELTYLTLRRGEEIRTPLVALVFWEGDGVVRAQNLWRRWMFAHNIPRTKGGKLPSPILFGNTSLEFNEMTVANEENQRYFIDRYLEERVPIDYWWMDAGWYPCGGQWPKTGTWEPDPARFPRGLRAISDHGRGKGVKTLVWFEPERVAAGTWLAQNHPDWLLGRTLLDLSRTDARDWLTDHVDGVLREQGISLYRQDFNMDPLSFWRKHDAPDRQGLTENLHVQNYLAFWDALRRRHPELIIDSCASGGRRNDLETMRRAIALHPTDYNYGDLTAKQAFHASLFQWLPCYGSNTVPIDIVSAYAYRSGHAMNMVLGYDLRRKDLDYPLLRKLAAEWRQIVPCYAGDYYPLTPYNRDDDRWLAWQFDRPEQGDGVVEAFRRPRAEETRATLRLSGLDLSSRYRITDLATGKASAYAGSELLERGLEVEIESRPGATAIRYERAR